MKFSVFFFICIFLCSCTEKIRFSDKTVWCHDPVSNYDKNRGHVLSLAMAALKNQSKSFARNGSSFLVCVEKETDDRYTAIFVAQDGGRGDAPKVYVNVKDGKVERIRHSR